MKIFKIISTVEYNSSVYIQRFHQNILFITEA